MLSFVVKKPLVIYNVETVLCCSHGVGLVWFSCTVIGSVKGSTYKGNWNEQCLLWAPVRLCTWYWTELLNWTTKLCLCTDPCQIKKEPETTEGYNLKMNGLEWRCCWYFSNLFENIILCDSLAAYFTAKGTFPCKGCQRNSWGQISSEICCKPVHG